MKVTTPAQASAKWGQVILLCALFPTSAATLYVAPNSPSPTPPYTNWQTAAHEIQPAINVALSGDMVLVTNGTYATGGRAATDGTTNRVLLDKAITLQSVNGPEATIIEGYQVPGSTNGDEAIRCAYLTTGAALSGFTLRNGGTRTYLWAPGTGGGALCSTGSFLSNCIVKGNSAYYNGGGVAGGTLLSCTIISNCAAMEGGGASQAVLNNCQVISNTAGSGGGVESAKLTNCTIAGNFAYHDGGGATFSWLNQCVLNGNSAPTGLGGGAMEGRLWNCLITSNFAGDGGGFSIDLSPEVFFLPELYNCTIARNSAWDRGGGVMICALTNCIIYDNSAPTDPNFSGDTGNGLVCILNACCTFPLPNDTYSPGSPPGYGPNNITHAPLFADALNGDFRLQSNSPCINSGLSDFAVTPSDLDDLPRVSGGTVDMGAYEFQNAGSIISIAWLQQYGLPTDGSADFEDPDADGMNNWKEWICGTNPTNSLSVLRLLAPDLSRFGVTLTWLSVTNRAYSVERATSLTEIPTFSAIATNIPGGTSTATYTDTNALQPGAFFRVGTHR